MHCKGLGTYIQIITYWVWFIFSKFIKDNTTKQ